MKLPASQLSWRNSRTQPPLTSLIWNSCPPLLAKYLKLYTIYHLYSSITSQTHMCLCSFVQQFSHVLLKKINNFQRTNTIVFVLWQNDWLWNPVAGKKELLTSSQHYISVRLSNLHFNNLQCSEITWNHHTGNFRLTLQHTGTMLLKYTYIMFWRNDKFVIYMTK
jgi:hypothetical protein